MFKKSLAVSAAIVVVLTQFACSFLANLPFGAEPANPPAVEMPAAVSGTQPSTQEAAAGQAPSAATSGSNDISCLMGYWEVEPESAKNAANLLITLETMTIEDVSPSTVYYFYPVESPGASPTPYRMDVYYTDVLIKSTVRMPTGTGDNHRIEMHINGVMSSNVNSDRPGHLFYTPIAAETALQVTDLWWDGAPLVEGSTDISNYADTTSSHGLLYECLSSEDIALALESTPLVRTILRRTAPVTHIAP